MRLPSPGSTGAITAEWVLALPAVIAVLGVGVGALSIQLERAQLERLSADAARMVSLGADVGAVQADVASRVDAEITVLIREGNTALSQCVSIRSNTTVPALPWVSFPIESETCALEVLPGDR